MQHFPSTSDMFISKRADIFGAFASGLCLIHCLATPLIFVVQACSASRCSGGPLWWSMIDYLFLAISLLAIYYSTQNTKLRWMSLALYSSWGILALFILNESFQLFPLHHTLFYLPALGLVGLHLYNRRYCQCDTAE